MTAVFRHEPDVLAVGRQSFDRLFAVDGGDDDVFVLRLDNPVEKQLYLPGFGFQYLVAFGHVLFYHVPRHKRRLRQVP